MRLEPILVEALLADQETQRIKVNHVEEYDNADQLKNQSNPISNFQLLWEPYLKMNASTFPFPDKDVDLPKVSQKFHGFSEIYLKSVICKVFNFCRLQPRDRRW